MTLRRSHVARRVSLAVGAAGLVIAFASIPAASLTDSTPTLQVRAIDARGGNLSVDLLYSGKEKRASTKVTIDGSTVATSATPLRDTGLPSSIVTVLDTSIDVSNASVQLALEDLGGLMPKGGAVEQLGLITTGDGPAIVAQPATTAESVIRSADGVAPRGTSSLWSGLVMAAKMLDQTGESQRNLVLVVGSRDDARGASFTEAVNNLRDVGVTAHVIALEGSSADGTLLRDMVGRLGGSFQVGTDSEFSKLYGNVDHLIASQYRITVPNAPKSSAELESLTIAVGDDVVRASYRPGLLSVGAEKVAPAPAIVADEASLLSRPVIKIGIIGCVALAAGGGFFALASLVTKRNEGLKYALRHYDDTYAGSGIAEEDGQSLAKSAILQRAVEVTGSIAEERGFLVRVENLLERADLPLRAAEALTFYLGGAFASVIITFVLTESIMFAAGVVLLALIAPGFYVDFRAKMRKKKFTRLLPDMLQLLAGTLRAGYSIGQGFEAVSGEIDEPMGKELRRAVTEARLGRPLDEALESVAIRMDSEDFGWAVMAIKIQREVGGNLAELLMTVADTMTQRERLRRDVASLTAEGRMSAIILGLLPPGLGVAMYFMNPDYIAKLFSGTGLILLVASIFMMLIGFVWMKKTITIEV